MRFRFEAVSATGVRERGEIAARDERAALKALGARDLTVLAITLDNSPIAASRRASRISAADRALAVRQLAGLIEGGVTLPNALASVAENSESSAIAAELGDVKNAVTAGETLAASFDRAPKLFPTVERQVVVAGAEAGDLSRVLLRLADFFEARDVLRGKLVGALVYPMLVGIVALGVIAALLVFVMPQIIAAFAQTKQALPWLTRAMIVVAGFMKSYGIYVLALLACALVLMVWLARGPMKARFLSLLQRLPLIGSLAQSADEVRTLSTLAMLTESAVPLPRALAAAALTARFPANAARYRATRDAIERGSGVAQSLADTQAVDGMTLELVRQGEAVGSIAAAFSKAAHLKNQSLERRLQWFATLVEPIMIIVLGGVVLVLVLAVMLPIVTLNSAVR
ncbi:MAG: type II secretion system F family protein [Betaproteobacteria bacterium]|nr:MAG: type II secretion system F family protein [Betaproteobacteria bacterium]